MGDETLVNVDTPAFRWGGEVYDRIGVDSNGYLVIGGGTAEDNQCCGDAVGWGTSRTDNVIAPYWTDLNPGAGGAVRIGVLTDGTTDWIVADYAQVPAFGTGDPNSFQVWIQVGNIEGA